MQSPFPKLSIQGSGNLHKLEFSLETGFPVILRHSATRELPAYCMPHSEWGTAVKGRKWVRYYQPWDFVGTTLIVATLLLGREGVPGGFGISTGSMETGDKSKCIDVDEATGRLLFMVGKPGALKLWLVDISA